MMTLTSLRMEILIPFSSFCSLLTSFLLLCPQHFSTVSISSAPSITKCVYALKEIKAGEQFEVEIYPQFKSMDEVPEEGRSIKRDNSKAQRNLNDKNARKYVERLINRNFGDKDLWITLTYDDAHLPPDGDIDAAVKNMQNFIRRVNYVFPTGFFSFP